MTQSSASGSENDVDRKLDSLISRIQSLSGNDEAQRPKQQPRLASGSAPGAAPGSSPGQSSGPAAARPSISRPVAAAGSSGGGAGSVSGGISPGVSGSAAGPNPGGPRPRPAGQPPQAGRHPATAAAKKDRTPYGFTPTRDEPWRPLEPEDCVAAGVNESILEAIVYRFLANIGESEGRKIADQVKLPFRMVEPLLTRLKMEQNVAYKSSTATNDYVYILTESGRQIARNHNKDCTYYGSCPVPLDQYIASVKRQTIEGQYPKRNDLLNAFNDLLINPKMLDKLGPAVASGRGMFLFGFPGNGKTSIAERVTGAFGKYIWIPRAIDIDGDVLRLWDPMCHTMAMPEAGLGLLDDAGFDKRWVRIERPTIIAGGELTMDMLEVQCSRESNISEVATAAQEQLWHLGD